MGKKLVRAVSFHDEKGRLHSFAPGDEVPEWAQAHITNERVWEEEGPVEEEDEVAPPPRTGNGSGRAAWAAYLKRVMPGMEAAPDDSREDIIDFLQKNGKRV